MSGYNSWYPAYVSVADKRAKADKAIEKLRKKNKELAPVLLEGRTLAATWWGKAWNRNLESYADYESRIGRGRSYVRNHMVLDLKLSEGLAEALVQGSSSKPYAIAVTFDPISKEQWQRIIDLCDHRIASLEQLSLGKFPRELEALFHDRQYGLFPSPDEIHFRCSCPDYAFMCKHVAATLYGIGARLDQDPLLFFKLRSVDCQDLIARSMESKMESMLKNAGKKSSRSIASEDIGKLFGI